MKEKVDHNNFQEVILYQRFKPQRLQQIKNTPHSQGHLLFSTYIPSVLIVIMSWIRYHHLENSKSIFAVGANFQSNQNGLKLKS